MPLIARRDPPTPTFSADNIPNRLRSHDNWTLWKYSQTGQNGNQIPLWDKPPCNLHGVQASYKDNQHSFAVAVSTAKRIGGGVGFVLANSGLVCVDLDNCVDPLSGDIDPWALDIIHDLQSYTEISPSGSGLKIWIEGQLSFVGKKNGSYFGHSVEVFAGGSGYCTVTGEQYGKWDDIATPGKTRLDQFTANILPDLKRQKRPERMKGEITDDVSRIVRDIVLSIHLESVLGRSSGTRDVWLRVGASLHHCGEVFEDLFLEWSAREPGFVSEKDCLDRWHSFGSYTGEMATLGTLVYYAKKCGWSPSTEQSETLSKFQRTGGITATLAIERLGDPARHTDGEITEAVECLVSPEWLQRGVYYLTAIDTEANVLFSRALTLTSDRSRVKTKEELEEAYGSKVGSYLAKYLCNLPVKQKSDDRPKRELTLDETERCFFVTDEDVIGFEHMASQAVEVLDLGGYFRRGKIIVRDDMSPLEPIGLMGAISDFRQVQKFKNGSEQKNAVLSRSLSEQIMATWSYIRHLKPVNLITNCPILIEDEHKKLTLISGYHQQSGTYVGGTGQVTEVEFDEAVKLILDLFHDFRFSSEGDRSRAVAGILSPAFSFGQLLGDDARCPIDIGIADSSQSGKGYRQRIVSAVYAAKQSIVTQSDGSIGSLQEKFDRAIVRGEPFIVLDNVRGSVNCPGIESFMTEDHYSSRTPYGRYMDVDPRRFHVAITSNGMETGKDLLNRANVVGIMKQPKDHKFKLYGGDRKLKLLSWVRENQGMYLGAVYSIIRRWHQLGKNENHIVESGRAFNAWLGVMDWIVQELFHLPTITADSDKSTFYSPHLRTLRIVSIAVREAKREHLLLRAGEIAAVIEDQGRKNDLCHGDHTPIEQRIGIDLAKCFEGEQQYFEQDDIKVHRFAYLKANGKPSYKYLFGDDLL